jgi:protein tyrosine phosphatase (PTP) superfamily phosphohydrolase (DUF442 family)
MLSLRPFRTRFGRAAPPARAHPRLALLALAGLTLLAEGCASLRDPCGQPRCGLFSGCNLRLRNPFRRDVIVTDPCGEPALGVPVEGAPAVVPGAVIPAPAAVPAAPAEEIPQLEPAPSGTSSPTTGQTSPNRKTLYETQKPPGGTSTSRREARAPLATAARPAPGDEPLIELPPLSAPAATVEEPTPPVPPPAEAVELPAERPPQPADAQPVSLAEGIARFKVVEPQLAAGSVPSAAGWTFLIEKGYRTVLDLRPRAEAQPGDDAAAHHAGLRYVVLPVTPETLDEIVVTRFEDEIAQAGNRPLFFFDADGSRPAALWRLHLLARGVSEAEADAAVAEIGPSEPRLREAVARYLSAHKPRTAAADPEPAAPADPPVKPAVHTETAAPSATAPDLPLANAAAAPEPAPSTVSDPTAWRPYAAMILTGLSVPLAFFGRTALGSISFRRASLPAPATRPLSLPASSGE